jgi:hypothetical protein
MPTLSITHDADVRATPVHQTIEIPEPPSAVRLARDTQRWRRAGTDPAPTFVGRQGAPDRSHDREHGAAQNGTSGTPGAAS